MVRGDTGADGRSRSCNPRCEEHGRRARSAEAGRVMVIWLTQSGYSPDGTRGRPGLWHGQVAGRPRRGPVHGRLEVCFGVGRRGGRAAPSSHPTRGGCREEEGGGTQHGESSHSTLSQLGDRRCCFTSTDTASPRRAAATAGVPVEMSSRWGSSQGGWLRPSEERGRGISRQGRMAAAVC